MRINGHLRSLWLAITAALLCLCAQATVSAQSDRSDRPGPEEGRTTLSERHSDRDTAPDRRSPADIARERLSRLNTAVRAGNLRSIAAMPGVASGDDVWQTYERAMHDYEAFSNDAGSNYIALQTKDFAPAYYIVKDPDVSKQRSNGFDLAKEVASLKYKGHYAKFLQEELKFDKNRAREIEKAARAIVNSIEKQTAAP